MAAVSKACRCASLPGETCRAAVSTSRKPSASNQARNAALIRLRASRNGRRSAWFSGRHQGEGEAVDKGNALLGVANLARIAIGGRYPTQIRAAQGRRGIKDVLVTKVAASSLRKGSVVDMDGKLYVVLNAENIHPGKGTPVTQLNMRRISDGVKVSERYRTTEQVERAFVDQRDHTFLYQDGEGYHFMNPETYDQLVASEDVIGDLGAYLQENMTVVLSTHNDAPIALELPR